MDIGWVAGSAAAGRVWIYPDRRGEDLRLSSRFSNPPGEALNIELGLKWDSPLYTPGWLKARA